MIKLSFSEICCLEVIIEDKPLLLKIDTGLTGYVSLQKNTIKKLKDKEFCGEKHWLDIHGNKYVSSKYLIPSIKIGKFLEFNNTTLQEENQEFIENFSSLDLKSEHKTTSSYEAISKEIGLIGLECIRLMGLLLFDYKNNCFYLIKNLDVFFKEKNLLFEDFVCYNMKNKDKFIYIDINTDFGMKSFILDTGSELTILNPSNNQKNKINTKNFVINNFDFGSIDLRLFPIPDQLEADGILGLDFLKKGPFILDFENKVVYFSKNEINALKLQDI